MRVGFVVWSTPVAQPRKWTNVPTTKDDKVLRGPNGRIITNSYVPTEHPVHQFRYDTKEAGRQAMANVDLAPKDQPLILQAKFYLPRPTWCDALVGRGKERRPKYSAGPLRHAHRPDLGNLLKSLEDALKGVCWEDDDQVQGYGDSGKFYHEAGGQPRVEIELWSVSIVPEVEDAHDGPEPDWLGYEGGA